MWNCEHVLASTRQLTDGIGHRPGRLHDPVPASALQPRPCQTIRFQDKPHREAVKDGVPDVNAAFTTAYPKLAPAPPEVTHGAAVQFMQSDFRASLRLRTSERNSKRWQIPSPRMGARRGGRGQTLTLTVAQRDETIWTTFQF